MVSRSHLRSRGVEGVHQLARLLEVRQLVEIALILRLGRGDDPVKDGSRVKLDLFHHFQPAVDTSLARLGLIKFL